MTSETMHRYITMCLSLRICTARCVLTKPLATHGYMCIDITAPLHSVAAFRPIADNIHSTMFSNTVHCIAEYGPLTLSSAEYGPLTLSSAEYGPLSLSSAECGPLTLSSVNCNSLTLFSVDTSRGPPLPASVPGVFDVLSYRTTT